MGVVGDTLCRSILQSSCILFLTLLPPTISSLGSGHASLLTRINHHMSPHKVCSTHPHPIPISQHPQFSISSARFSFRFAYSTNVLFTVRGGVGGREEVVKRVGGGWGRGARAPCTDRAPHRLASCQRRRCLSSTADR